VACPKDAEEPLGARNVDDAAWPTRSVLDRIADQGDRARRAPPLRRHQTLRRAEVRDRRHPL